MNFFRAAASHPRPFLFALLWVSLVFCGAAGAQNLPDLLALVWQEHPQLRAKRADWQAQREGVTVAARQFLPTPSLASDVGPANVQGSNRTTTARLTFPVYTGGQLTADLEIAELRQRMAAAELEQAGRELVFQFFDLYRSWWFHTLRSEVLLHSLQRMDGVRQMMSRRASAGVSAALDLAQAELQWQRTMDERQQALRLREQAMADMAVFAGRPVQPQFEPLASWPALPFTLLGDVQAQVLASHPGMVVADVSLALAQAELRRVKAGALPNVSLRVEKQYGAYYGSLEPGSRVYLNSQFTLGAGLSALPLQEQAAVRAQSAEEQVAAQRLSLTAQVQKVWNEHGQATQQLGMTSQQLRTQEALADSGVRLFAGGRRSWQDLLSLQREVFQLQAQQAELESAVMASRARLLLLANVFPQFTFSSY